MKVLIVAGGTGSIALQTGLFGLFKESTDKVDVKVLVNAYDNGLSTGAVRRVMGGNILGPSDVRKNQTTRYSLKHRHLLHSGGSALLSLLDKRITVASQDAQRYVLDEIASARLDSSRVLQNAVKTFFANPLADKIDYTDFALANIIYAGLAAQNNNSLRAAAKIMANVLTIEDHVILNDDKSLFLGGITRNGIRVTDEGDIVSWNNPDDPFVDIFFTNAQGEEDTPVLCDEAVKAIQEADVIILSSGTQWSSLIPTYASTGFKSAIAKSSAKILMVMNRVPDKDAPAQGADDIVNLLVPRYFPEGRIDLIVDSTSQELMHSVKAKTQRSLLKSVNSFKIGTDLDKKETKHNPHRLAVAICKTIYREYLNATHFMFDYDDTLVGRGNKFPIASTHNKKALSALMNERFVAVCTGNSIRAVNLDVSPPSWVELNNQEDMALPSITVYADGGVNKYEYDPNARYKDEEVRPYTFSECLIPEAKFPQSGPRSASSHIATLCLAGIPAAKIENRGDVMLTIKPIDPEYRDIVRNLAAKLLDRTGLLVKNAGRTSIEIATCFVSKAPAVERVLASMADEEELVFVGDEFDDGNDKVVGEFAKYDSRLKCLRVKSPVDTAIFMIALNTHGI
jgi:2-phospho-L-lactate transferase/gluconeogenesis factor (CofD/UPF0052 family)